MFALISKTMHHQSVCKV